MNNEIQKFKGASLRTLTDEAGEPWFVAKGQTYFIRRYCLQPSLEVDSREFMTMLGDE